MRELKVVGQSVARVDAVAKVTGAAMYVADMRRQGMLRAKLLRSPHAHANITHIDASEARALPGVAAVLTYKDVPAIPFTCCGHPYPYDTPEDCLILSPRLRYVGDPVAAVAAETDEIALEALALIKVEYELLPAYFTPEDALADGTEEIHAGTKNITDRCDYETGDVDAAFAAADYIIEDSFITPNVTHAPIEPHASMAEPDRDTGRMTLHAGTQVPNIMRQRLAKALGLKVGQLRVVQHPIGGGFGGKQEPVYEPLNVALALAARRPVMLELTREECMSATRTRHPAKIKLRTAIDKGGNILAREVDIVTNTGAYSSHGHNVIWAMATPFNIDYPTPNLRFRGATVYTNTLIAGAMRGYGRPQYYFAQESHIDHIAATVGVSPLEYRLKHFWKPGDTIYDKNITIRTYGLRQAIEKGRAAIGWDAFQSRPKENGTVRRGMGMAVFSYGQNLFGFSPEISGARVMVNEDATAVLFTNAAECGQGSSTTMAQICAEALGVPFDWVTVISGDTDVCPWDTGAFASRQTYMSGHAVKKAALGCKKQILSHYAKKHHYAPERLNAAEGYVIDSENGQRLAEMGKITWEIVYSMTEPVVIECAESYYPTQNMMTFGACFAQVAVDTKTGKVEVERLVSAFDAGRLVNPLAAMGQLNGGNIMGMGFALTEQVLVNPKNGQVYNDNLLDYKIPTFADVPELLGYFIETDEPTSAYGNKSLGEPPVVPPGAAIRNAVFNATGVAVNEAPLTAQRVLEALLAAKKEG